MKKIKISLVVGMAMIGIMSFGFLPVFAGSVSSQDLHADEALIAPTSGALPATGGQALGLVYTPPGLPSSAGAAQASKNIAAGIVTPDQSDKRGRVYEIKGEARIAMQNIEGWKEVKTGTVVEEGNVIITQKNGKLSIAFDENYLNVVHIPENTRVVFRAIEPTDMFLEDGTIYNMLDGLPKGTEWKVTTPTAVAAVRGTYWLVNFTSSSGEFIAATIDIPDDPESHSIDVIDILDNGQTGGSVNIPEGNQLNLAEGQTPDPSLLGNIDADLLEQIQNVMKDLVNKKNSNGALPPTGGDELPGGGDSSANNFLDPQLDTGATTNEPPESTEFNESPSSPEEEEPEEEPEECNSFDC